MSQAAINIDGKYASHFCFADDVIFISSDFVQSKSMLEQLNGVSS